MSIINYASREIQFKIVYYGPALCGKTTNLAYIHQRINPENRGDLVSLATAADRTLFFDFLPLNAVVIKGFVTKFQLYTVPGQVIYNATRQLVLRSVDGVIFVAESQWEKMEENVESVQTAEAAADLAGVLADLLKQAEAERTVVIDRGGNVISQFGDMTVMDVTIIAALAAGSFAATKELARRIGEIEFNALYHQGNGNHIFMNSVDDETIMITVFGPRTTVGLVRFYSTGTAQQVAVLLKSLQKDNHGFSFNASDITAAPIFADATPPACGKQFLVRSWR